MAETNNLNYVQTDIGFFQALAFIPNANDYVAVLVDPVDPNKYIAYEFPHYAVIKYWQAIETDAKVFNCPIPASFFQNTTDLITRYKFVCRRADLPPDIPFHVDMDTNYFMDEAEVNKIKDLFTSAS